MAVDSGHGHGGARLDIDNPGAVRHIPQTPILNSYLDTYYIVNSASHFICSLRLMNAPSAS